MKKSKPLPLSGPIVRWKAWIVPRLATIGDRRRRRTPEAVLAAFTTSSQSIGMSAAAGFKKELFNLALDSINYLMALDLFGTN